MIIKIGDPAAGDGLSREHFIKAGGAPAREIGSEEWGAMRWTSGTSLYSALKIGLTNPAVVRVIKEERVVLGKGGFRWGALRRFESPPASCSHAPQRGFAL